MVAVNVHVQRWVQIIASIYLTHWLARARQFEAQSLIYVDFAIELKYTAEHLLVIFKREVAKVSEGTVSEANHRWNVVPVKLLRSPKDCPVATERYYEINFHPIFLVLVLE